MTDFFDAAKWEQAWKNDPHTGVNKMKAAGIDTTHAFDYKAVSFNKEVFSDEGKRRTKRIMNWIEGQGVRFQDATVLDIGAASGGFSVPFAERGAIVTAVEPCLPLAELLYDNIKQAGEGGGTVTVVKEPFEEIDIDARGWRKKFDLVFVSMCPVITDWESVEKVMSCAKQFCYISLPAGTMENSLKNEIFPLVTDQPHKHENMEMAYLLHLLYLKGYAYESIVTREAKTTVVDHAKALQDAMVWLGKHDQQLDEGTKTIVADYLERTYPSGQVVVHEGGRYGKVLVRLQDQSMYTREQ
ncbi:class I SAM-dependent methyltransferase [Paenibacillus sp. LHD-117]|uniref:class I SAM-dependent methyltransferase n=1 Tax=Paenibacillus sp. LHD-117 TaxID=3071412 RepID=UPI0027DFBEC7|nr:class I SAM-dependent methyltransferase [Paenibacillus sp. LHD-117]MDQ6421723.1 class I SAM-dependent methyltransferase [Paenibacillus sp. LHD-117]